MVLEMLDDFSEAYEIVALLRIRKSLREVHPLIDGNSLYRRNAALEVGAANVKTANSSGMRCGTARSTW